MALTLQKQQDAARWVCGQLFPPQTTAHFHLGEALAAIQAVDGALDATLNQAVAAAGGTTTVINALAAQLPSPWSTGSAAEKVMIAVAVFLARGGLI